MGIFNRKSRGKAGRSPRKSAAKAGPGVDKARALLAAKVVAGVVLVVALSLGWAAAQGKLKQYVEQRQRPVAAEAVQLANAPAWMSQTLRRDLRQLVAQSLASHGPTQASLARATADLSQNAWVAKVDRVERLADGRVRVRAAYRQPVALVQSRHGYHLIDAAGVQLPGLYIEHQIEALGLPVIVGVHAGPTGAGQLWPGQDLQAGLALVRTLAGEPYLPQIVAYDVGVRDERGRIRLVLRTAGGSVRWGLPVGEEGVIEPAASVKKQRLRVVHERRGSIDAGGKVVDVFGADVFVHNDPVTAQPAANR